MIKELLGVRTMARVASCSLVKQSMIDTTRAS